MSKKIIVINILIVVLSFSWLFGEDTWIKSYDPFNADGYDVEDVIVCSDGGLAVNGLFYNVEPGGYEDWWGFLIKTDCDGNFLWAKKDTVSFMSESESDAFVETSDGGFISTVSNMWGGTALIKRNSSGTREWVIDGAGLYSDSMVNTDDGNIVLGGRCNTYPTLRKITEDGVILWSKNYILSGDGDGKIQSIVQTSDNAFAATGFSDGNVADLFILKANTIGDSLWSHTYDAYEDFDEGRCIIQNNNNDLIVLSRLSTQNSSSASFLWHFTANGQNLDSQEFENNNPFSLLMSNNDTFIHYSYIGYYQTVITKLDSNYNIIWQNIIDSYPAVGDRSIISSNTGFICGLVLYPGNIGLAKLNSNGQVVSTGEVLASQLDSKLTNNPNPFNPTTNISFHLPYDSNILLQIFNCKGQLVKTLINEYRNSGKHSVIWEAKNKASGVYYYRLETDNDVEYRKMILIK